MHRLQNMCFDAAIAALILIPLFWLLNRYWLKSKTKSLCFLIFSFYLTGMFAVAGLPDVCYIRYNPRFNFEPFAYMFTDSTSMLNVLLFMPLGFLLPVYWTAYRSGIKTVGIGFCISLLIEFLQIFSYRASDVNDLMTNTLGTLLGWCTARILLLILPQVKVSESRKEFYHISAVSFLVMFFLHPFLEQWISITF